MKLQRVRPNGEIEELEITVGEDGAITLATGKPGSSRRKKTVIPADSSTGESPDALLARVIGEKQSSGFYIVENDEGFKLPESCALSLKVEDRDISNVRDALLVVMEAVSGTIVSDDQAMTSYKVGDIPVVLRKAFHGWTLTARCPRTSHLAVIGSVFASLCSEAEAALEDGTLIDLRNELQCAYRLGNLPDELVELLVQRGVIFRAVALKPKVATRFRMSI